MSAHDFAVSKARNMRLLLEPYAKTDAHRALLSQYKETDVETLTRVYLAPLYTIGMLSVAQQRIVDELAITDAALIAKIGLYLQCFCEALL